MVLRNVIFSLVILALGLVGAKLIVGSKPKAVINSQRDFGVLVKRARYTPKTQEVIVRGQGLVEPAQRVNLTAQVSGVVTRIHPEFSIGGRVKKGTKLIQIDPTDYGLAINEAKARVRIAERPILSWMARRVH